MAGQGPCERRENTVSTNNGLHVCSVQSGVVHNLLTQFFTLVSSKIEVSETYFFDIVTTHNDHPSNVMHVLGSNFVFFTLFGD